MGSANRYAEGLNICILDLELTYFLMELSLFQIIGFSILLIIIGIILHYIYTMKDLNNLFKKLLDNIIIYWYLIVFSVTTIFVIVNYDECINLHFTSDFNGKNLIFLFWLAIIVFPFFESFEILGVSFKKRKENKEVENIRDQYQQEIANAEKINSKKGGKK